MEKKRKNTRNKVWPETRVFLEYRDKISHSSNTLVKTRASVDNMSASGLFVLTDEHIPTGTELSIIIDFDPEAEPANTITAEGVVVRSENKGLAIKFTKIDTQKLGECIMNKLNSR